MLTVRPLGNKEDTLFWTLVVANNQQTRPSWVNKHPPNPCRCVSLSDGPVLPSLTPQCWTACIVSVQTNFMAQWSCDCILKIVCSLLVWTSWDHGFLMCTPRPSNGKRSPTHCVQHIFHMKYPTTARSPSLGFKPHRSCWVWWHECWGAEMAVHAPTPAPEGMFWTSG